MRRGLFVAASLALTSCGRIGFDGLTASLVGDAAAGDGAGDATDAPTDTLAVVVDRAGVPLAGIEVWTNHPGGALDDRELTDASGRATLHVDAGGAVSAEMPSVFVPAEGGQVVAIRSVIDARPGETYHFGPVVSACDLSSRAGSVTFTWPTSPGGTRLATTCENDAAGTAGAFTWSLPVAHPATLDLVVEQLDASNLLASTAPLLGATIADGNLYAVGAGDFTAATAATLEVDGLPPGTDEAAVKRDEITAGGAAMVVGFDLDRLVTEQVFSTSIGVPAVVVSRAVQTTYFTGSNVEGYYIEPAAELAMTMPSLPPLFDFHPGSDTVSWTETTPGVAQAFELVFTSTTAGITTQWAVRIPYSASGSLGEAAVPADIPPLSSLGSPALLAVSYGGASTWDDVRTLDLRSSSTSVFDQFELSPQLLTLDRSIVYSIGTFE